MNGPSGMRGKVFALGLLAAVGLAVYGTVIEPLFDEYEDLRRATDQSNHLLAKYGKLEATRAQLEADIAEMKSRGSRDRDYLTASSETLAGAEIQGHLKTFLENVGAQQRSVQTLAPEAVDGMLRVTVRTQFIANTDSLYALLYKLETATPLLFVETLDIRRQQNRRRARQRQEVEADAAGLLDVRLDLYGFLRAPSA